ncbi:MAG: hypothetical protein DHS20C02_03680 [Micavibrio sp.]|nr:MAG: hypothetical protein DHS20C02_03680 [Micavibrio sp.]
MSEMSDTTFPQTAENSRLRETQLWFEGNTIEGECKINPKSIGVALLMFANEAETAHFQQPADEQQIKDDCRAATLFIVNSKQFDPKCTEAETALTRAAGVLRWDDVVMEAFNSKKSFRPLALAQMLGANGRHENSSIEIAILIGAHPDLNISSETVHGAVDGFAERGETGVIKSLKREGRDMDFLYRNQLAFAERKRAGAQPSTVAGHEDQHNTVSRAIGI